MTTEAPDRTARPTADDPAADRILDEARRLAAAGESPPRPARDEVNLPMIRNWVEAIGDANPVYVDPDAAAASPHRGLVAPPAMAQVWTMRGLRPAADPDDPLSAMSAALDRAGYTSVVATNSDQTYHRYLRPGERITVRTRLDGVVGPKRTGLGEGWFVTTRSTWYAGDEPVAEMMFRVLKYRPPGPGDAGGAAAPSDPGAPIRPLVSRDTAFFWAGTAAGELRIQRCGGCGLLRHPPGPMCPRCGATRPGYVLAAGTGEVYSYVVHHHPPVPGRRTPFVVALVELPEGVRMVGELRGIAPDQVRIGLPVRVEYVPVDDELTLPAWRPAGDPGGVAGAAVGAALPELRIDVTPTFVISTALATRDFQDVHHDRDRAVARGSRDIFVNILTSTGLVQRYVTDWAGPGALIRSISIRLGVPCYAGDMLTLVGRVAARDGDRYTIEVVGRDSLGDHLTGRVEVTI